jgi:nicotinate-nucleotide--dimethylbenzimidazole phosphoribosyltransferase
MPHPDRLIDDLRDGRAQLPAFDQAAADAAGRRWDRLTKPPGSLGRLEALVCWLAGWQARDRPRLDRVQVLVFAGNHGVAARGVSAYPATVTAEMVRNFENGGAAINQLAGMADAALRIVPIELDRPTDDLAGQAAMSERDCLAAFSLGMRSVDHCDLLALGEMGIGNTTAAAAILAALFGGGGSWVGPGTGLDAAGERHKREVVEAALRRHAGRLDEPFEVLRRLGGREIAAMTGAIFGARLQRTPLLLDGFVTAAAAAVARALDRDALGHVQAAHRSLEPGHRRVLEELDLVPLLDLGMRLGEASGAALAVPLARAALACYDGMATFEEAGVSAS